MNHTHPCLYSSAARHHRSLHLPRKGWPGWVDLSGWSHTVINVLHRELNLNMVTYTCTNRAQSRLTLFIELNALPLPWYARPSPQWKHSLMGSKCKNWWLTALQHELITSCTMFFNCILGFSFILQLQTAVLPEEPSCCNYMLIWNFI